MQLNVDVSVSSACVVLFLVVGLCLPALEELEHQWVLFFSTGVRARVCAAWLSVIYGTLRIEPRASRDQAYAHRHTRLFLFMTRPDYCTFLHQKLWKWDLSVRLCFRVWTHFVTPYLWLCRRWSVHVFQYIVLNQTTMLDAEVGEYDIH